MAEPPRPFKTVEEARAFLQTDEAREAFEAAKVAMRGGWPGLVLRASEAGYGLAVIGSLSRDVDVIAVPWREEHDEEELVQAFLDYPCHVDKDTVDWRGWRSFVAVMAGPQGDHPHGRYFDVKVARIFRPDPRLAFIGG